MGKKKEIETVKDKIYGFEFINAGKHLSNMCVCESI